MNELIYHTITQSAQEVGGDYMLILTPESTIDEIVQYILSSKVIWFYDGALYHQVFAFEDVENAMIVYYYRTDESVASYRVGDGA